MAIGGLLLYYRDSSRALSIYRCRAAQNDGNLYLKENTFMKFLYNWFKKILNTEKSAEKVSEGQTTRSFENVVVGKIMEIEKHPNADRLQVVKVSVDPSLPASLPEGERGQGGILNIVCGASNIAVGQKVPVALVGAKMPAGFEIKEAEIRGVKSFGMLCAEDELELGTDHSGIMILNEKAEIGMDFAKYIK